MNFKSRVIIIGVLIIIVILGTNIKVNAQEIYHEEETHEETIKVIDQEEYEEELPLEDLGNVTDNEEIVIENNCDANDGYTEVVVDVEKGTEGTVDVNVDDKWGCLPGYEIKGTIDITNDSDVDMIIEEFYDYFSDFTTTKDTKVMIDSNVKEEINDNDETHDYETTNNGRCAIIPEGTEHDSDKVVFIGYRIATDEDNYDNIDCTCDKQTDEDGNTYSSDSIESHELCGKWVTIDELKDLISSISANSTVSIGYCIAFDGARMGNAYQNTIATYEFGFTYKTEPIVIIHDEISHEETIVVVDKEAWIEYVPDEPESPTIEEIEEVEEIDDEPEIIEYEPNTEVPNTGDHHWGVLITIIIMFNILYFLPKLFNKK